MSMARGTVLGGKPGRSIVWVSFLSTVGRELQIGRSRVVNKDHESIDVQHAALPDADAYRKAADAADPSSAAHVPHAQGPPHSCPLPRPRPALLPGLLPPPSMPVPADTTMSNSTTSPPSLPSSLRYAPPAPPSSRPAPPRASPVPPRSPSLRPHPYHRPLLPISQHQRKRWQGRGLRQAGRAQKQKWRGKDEFLKPIIVNGDARRIKDDNTLFLFNYRLEHMQEIASDIGLPDKPMKVDVLKNPASINVHLVE
ncbi:hypothetical protein D9615_010180 [Tricholomella constricta]|uniref:Uncharacterized protein n=1 Tax=Tricholomella constricta TaxID=117010 RepID=A0A8H5LUB7_9AGAR|nr:hypothetical protein D9615_010182 [Tricholomella constricta]KAF5369700.1 hypothetical protein D9615_010180 [Tricholomella constricta]